MNGSPDHSARCRNWMKNSKGWWYEDVTGWYPDNRELWIDGVKYLFDSKGYLL